MCDAPTSSNQNQRISNELADLNAELESVDSQLSSLRSKRAQLLEKKRKLEDRLRGSNGVVVDAEEWERTSFSWSDAVDRTLLEIFKFKKFRSLQKACVNAIMSGNDVIAIMSTGAGKSLCYQLPAVLQEGLTLVVSPLLSLIQDQLGQLERMGIEAATLNQNTSKDEVKRIEDAITKKNSSFRLLYVTPEKLAKSKRFMNKLEKSLEVGFLKLIAIDEVHCCSQWGHDFRPDFKFLNILKRQFKGVPILGLTATATYNVLEDVKDMLGIPAAIVFRAGFNRPNLKYEVITKEAGEKGENIAKIIKERFPSESGIVYCFSRKEAEEVAAQLRKNGVRARFYHAYMDPSDRSRVHNEWTAGSLHVIVATVAFGMGIDKPDVRFVIHHSLPKSIENYYQESGRAGRDGEPSTCILMFKIQDVFRQSTMVCTEKTGLDNLYQVVSYASSFSECRRFKLALHFDEPWETDWCQKQCDVCVSREEGTIEQSKNDISDLIREGVGMIRDQKLDDKGSGKITGSKLLDLLSKKGYQKYFVEEALCHMLLNKFIQEDFHFTPYSIISYVMEGPAYAPLEKNDQKRVLMTSRFCENKKAKARSTNGKRKVCELIDDGEDDDIVDVTPVKK